MSANPLIVIGAGASGLMAAGRAAADGVDVILLEKMARPGRKLAVTGKGRGNLSNSRELPAFNEAYGKNGRFLYGVFNQFFREELLALLADYGVSTNLERGGHIFTASGKAQDVVTALTRYLNDNGVVLRCGMPVTDIKVHQGRVIGVQAGHVFYPASAVILATGGASWPTTGSSGDGFKLARELGHRIMPTRPALVPLEVKEATLTRSMQGVDLKNVRLSAYRGRPEEITALPYPERDFGRGLGRQASPPLIESRQGDLMFTHFGLSGPIALRLSLAAVDALREGSVTLTVDLKPALSEAQLNQRLQRDFDHHGRRGYQHLLAELLPRKLIVPFAELSGIPAKKPGHQISAAERKVMTRLLKRLSFNFKRALPLAQAMVTAGGISLDQIDPRTLESRLVTGLFCCGEVLDIDGDSGGFNLQAAFSTGWVAGAHAAAYLLK